MCICVCVYIYIYIYIVARSNPECRTRHACRVARAVRGPTSRGSRQARPAAGGLGRAAAGLGDAGPGRLGHRPGRECRVLRGGARKRLGGCFVASLGLSMSFVGFPRFSSASEDHFQNVRTALFHVRIALSFQQPTFQTYRNQMPCVCA